MAGSNDVSVYFLGQSDCFSKQIIITDAFFIFQETDYYVVNRLGDQQNQQARGVKSANIKKLDYYENKVVHNVQHFQPWQPAQSMQPAQSLQPLPTVHSIQPIGQQHVQPLQPLQVVFLNNPLIDGLNSLIIRDYFSVQL